MFNPSEKLRVSKELIQKSKRRTQHSFSRREFGIILRSRPKTQHHQRKVLNPVGASKASSES